MISFFGKKLVWLFVFWGLGHGAWEVHAAKFDKVLLDQGDWITGEVKELKFGLLYFKTDDLGTAEIKWKRVRMIRSLQALEIHLHDGRRFFGSLDTVGILDRVMIDLPDTSFMVPINEIISLIKIDNGFFNRLNGNLTAGFSYTKASDVAQLTLGGNVTYRAFSWWSTLSLNTTVTSQATEITRNQNYTWDANLSLKDLWLAGTYLKLEQNSQLGLDLRTSVGIGGGKEMVHSNAVLFNTLVGLVGTRESTQDGSETVNLEGFASLSFKAYRYFFPKLNVSSQNNLFPSITEKGRIRFQTNNQVSWEVFKDFTLGLTFWYNYDNRPSSGAEKDDYAFTTTVGFIF